MSAVRGNSSSMMSINVIMIGRIASTCTQGETAAADVNDHEHQYDDGTYVHPRQRAA